jgi:nucleotide-binding universal stress UspA family protein
MVEIKRILCPIDFSEFSHHALDQARAIAEWYEAEITVLHVVSVTRPLAPAVAMAEAAYVPLPPSDLQETVEEVRRFAEPVAPSHGPSPKVVVSEGIPAKEIVRQAETLRADLLVMGTHGRSGFERLFLGSVTEKVIRSTHAPVLTVPAPVERPSSVHYKTILCPVEFSDPSMRALEYALRLAQETDAHLILVHVIEGLAEETIPTELSHFTVPEYFRFLEQDARARLKAAVPVDARAWCTPDERVAFGKASRTIVQLAGEEAADIIVMGVHGAGALGRRLFGSTTHHVIREAHCPVLTLRG